MTRRRISSGGTIALLVTLTLAGAAAAEGPPDLARIFDKGEVTVAMTPEDWPPFFYRHPTLGLRGLDVDLAKEAARQLGVRVRFVREARTFDEIVTMVADRRADLAISYLSDTLERAYGVRFTRPYAWLKPVVLINRSLAGRAHRGMELDRLLNHPDARIGITRGSSAESFADADYPRARIIALDTWEEITLALTEERLLAGMSDQIDARKWQTAHPEGAILIEAVVLENKPDSLAAAVNREDRHLLYWMNHFLAHKERDGTLARLSRHYIESDSWKKDDR